MFMISKCKSLSGADSPSNSHQPPGDGVRGGYSNIPPPTPGISAIGGFKLRDLVHTLGEFVGIS